MNRDSARTDGPPAAVGIGGGSVLDAAKAIADNLGKSEHTVRNHIKSVLSKSGATGQVDLMRLVSILSGSDTAKRTGAAKLITDCQAAVSGYLAESAIPGAEYLLGQRFEWLEQLRRLCEAYAGRPAGE